MELRTTNDVVWNSPRTPASFVFGIKLLFVSSGLLHVTNWTAREACAAIISSQCFLVRKHVVVAGRDTWPAGSACRLVEDWSVKRFKHFVWTSRRGPAAGAVQHFLCSSTGRGFTLKRYLSAERRTCTYSRAPRHSVAPSALSPTESLADVLPALHREHCLLTHTGSEDRLLGILVALPQL
ncbi:uncharacterized protein LOC119180047 [Rhipicephalus microplus]|uniref:uncharacterized protein LOC119180047 n=1 Tax=Rhipicephalus microplus TaxID=6941 RepID=UPI003F6D5EC3